MEGFHSRGLCIRTATRPSRAGRNTAGRCASAARALKLAAISAALLCHRENDLRTQLCCTRRCVAETQRAKLDYTEVKTQPVEQQAQAAVWGGAAAGRGGRTIYADFRCRSGAFGRLNQFVFHRLVGCFVPALPLLKELSLEVALQPATLVAIVDNSTLPLFQLFGPPGARYLTPPKLGDWRIQQLKWAPAGMRKVGNDEARDDELHGETPLLGPEMQPVHRVPTVQGRAQYLTDSRPQVVLHDYANRWFGTSSGDCASRQVVLRSIILAHRRLEEGRSFTDTTLIALQQRFSSNGTRLPVRVYSGTEPLRETLSSNVLRRGRGGRLPWRVQCESPLFPLGVRAGADHVHRRARRLR